MRMHATCINVHEVRGRLGGLLDPFTIVCPKASIFSIIFPLLKLQVLFFIVRFGFHPNIWEAFKSKFVGMS
jgi:hypothetical protein